jgi:hypothetical protein
MNANDSCPPTPLIDAAAWLQARLAPADLARLSSQGFVSAGPLPSGAACYKLRYRGADGRQRVLYLGVDQRLAMAVAADLKRRQRTIRWDRTVRRLVRQARSVLRRQKLLEPLLAEVGWRLHGRDYRRRAGPAAAKLPSTPPQLSESRNVQVRNSPGVVQRSRNNRAGNGGRVLATRRPAEGVGHHWPADDACHQAGCARLLSPTGGARGPARGAPRVVTAADDHAATAATNGAQSAFNDETRRRLARRDPRAARPPKRRFATLIPTPRVRRGRAATARSP